jgi:hypothetical protein
VAKREWLEDSVRPRARRNAEIARKKDSPNEPSLVNLNLGFGEHFLRFGNDVDSTPFAVKHDMTLDQSIQSVVVALAHVKARMKAVTNLSDEDISSHNSFAAKLLYATPLGVGISTVPARSLSLLMGHC